MGSWQAECGCAHAGYATFFNSTVANPSQAELLFKRHQQKKQTLNSVQKETILEKYGGEEYLDAPPRELLLAAQTEEYTEYSQTGRIIKGQEKVTPRSIYEEDIYPLNHTSIWGSWWRDGTWGYACCHSSLRNSYCSGDAGKEAVAASLEALKRTSAPRIVPPVEKTSEKSKGKAVDREKPADPVMMRGGVTEQEMEEYHRGKTSSADPMKEFLGQ